MNKKRKRSKNTGTSNVNKKFFILITIAILLILSLILIFVIKKDNSEEKENLLDTVRGYKGYIRVINQEEYDFYKYFVERDLSEEITEEELDEKVKEYTNEVNAIFYLGNKLGLYEPYSFERLQIRMQHENDERKIKLDQGEVVYGVQQFDLNTYFQYELSNLELSIQTYIFENCDDEMIKQAEEYYYAVAEESKTKESVTYEETISGVTETKTADRTQLNFFGKADMGLADFFERAEVGDTYEDIQNGETRSVTVKDIQYIEPDFEENMATAVDGYIQAEIYPELIDEVAKNNPVEFELN